MLRIACVATRRARGASRRCSCGHRRLVAKGSAVVDTGTHMAKLRIHNFSISLDGYGAGPNQSLDDPLGVGGTLLHGWAFATKTFRETVLGQQGGATGV